jgi:hypothetical protein
MATAGQRLNRQLRPGRAMAGGCSRKYNKHSPNQEGNQPMKFTTVLLATAFFSAPALAQTLPSGHPAIPAKVEGKGAPEAQLPQKAKVLSTLDAKPYTYIEVTQNNKTLWLAANAIALKKGDVIRFDNGMVMTNFHSKTLNRTFPSVLFVNSVVVSKEKE